MDNKYALKTSSNLTDKMADALVEIGRFADNTVEYPNIDLVESDNGVIAEWFYPIYNGTNEFSELTAIHMYTSQEAQFEEIGNLMLGIGLVEMKHYGKLGELIIKLGGKIERRFDNTGVTVGATVREALQSAIRGEEKTLEFYEKIVNRIEKIKTTSTTTIVLQLLAKLIADETRHKELLEEALSEFSKKQEEQQSSLEDLGNE